MPGTSLCKKAAWRVPYSGSTPTSSGSFQRAVQLLIAVQKSRRHLRLENRLRQGEIRPGLDLAAQVFDLNIRVVGAQVERTADEKGGGLPDIRPGVIQSHVEVLLDQLDQPGRHQVVIVHGFGVVADGGRVAHHHKDVADAQGVRRQQIALHAQQVAPAGGEVQRGLHPHLALHQVAHRPGAHAHARHWAVGYVDHIRPGLGQQAGARQQLVGGKTTRRVHLNRRHEPPGG